MKIFVTGGAGYVGSHCVKELIAHGHEVVAFDNLSKGHRGAVDPKATLVEGDLEQREQLHTLLNGQGFDAVMHFAASLNVGESVYKPLEYFRNNVANTINLLDAMQASNVKKLVFSSTCATYGVPETLPIHEDLPQQPINPYGHTKLAMEWALRASATAWGLGSVGLRYFNASGAAADGSIGQDYKPSIHLIPVTLEVALGQREKIFVFGTDYPTPDGSCVRDYIHVDDLASAHRLAIEALEPGTFEAYNVGTGTGTSVLELIEATRAVTGHAIPAEMGDRRPGDPPELYANADRIRARYNWQPKFTQIRDVIQTAWDWHSSHPEGYGDR